MVAPWMGRRDDKQSRLTYPVFCMCDLLHDECTYAGDVSGVLPSELMNHAFVICCMMNEHMLTTQFISCSQLTL